MSYAEVAPHPALRSLVQCYWATGADSAAHRVLPDGCIDVIVFGEGARVVGAMRTAIVVPPSGEAAIGVRFRPGEAARIVREAPIELTDRDAPLGDLWGGDGRALEASLVRAFARRHGSPSVLLAEARYILDAALLARIRAHGAASDLRIRTAADLLAKGFAVNEVAKRVALSERQLARRFSDRVGIAPKLFARVMRLQRAASALAHGNGGNGSRLAWVASEAGYADHAHFSRDSNALAGAAPSALAAELAPRIDPRIDSARALGIVSDSFKTGTGGRG